MEMVENTAQFTELNKVYDVLTAAYATYIKAGVLEITGSSAGQLQRQITSQFLAPDLKNDNTAFASIHLSINGKVPFFLLEKLDGTLLVVDEVYDDEQITDGIPEIDVVELPNAKECLLYIKGYYGPFLTSHLEEAMDELKTQLA